MFSLGWRPVRVVHVLLASALLFACVEGTALAQNTAKGLEPPSNSTRLVSSGWTLGCKPEKSAKELLCEASQTLVVANTRETVLAVFVTPSLKDGAPNGLELRFQLPHGLDIPAGVSFQIDQGPVQTPVIQTSNRIGLFARAELTDSLLAALKKGARMTVSFTAVNGHKLSIPITLDGFSAVFARMQ